jgi:hypothetical protein
MEVKPGWLENQMKKRLLASELKFMKRISDCMQLDHKRNEDILEN